MALYRTVCLSFWTDPKVADDFTPEDKYFYLYLFTNPHTNLCGCYEVSIRQMANETGYSQDTIERLIDRFSSVHKVLDYRKDTKEILLVNWHKYNWTKSEKFRKPLLAEIEKIKDVSFKEYLSKLFNGEEIGYGIDTTYIDTTCIDTSVTVTDTVYSNLNTSSNDITNQTKYISDSNLNTQLIEKPYSEEFKHSIGEWLQYKSEKRQTYKPMGFKQFLGAIDNNLKKYSEKQITDLMHLCMERNYQGLIWELMKEVVKADDRHDREAETGEGIYDDFAKEYFARRGIPVPKVR
jgi:hypothetical protein